MQKSPKNEDVEALRQSLLQQYKDHADGRSKIDKFMQGAHMKQNLGESFRRSKNFISIKDNQMISLKESSVVHVAPRSVFGAVQARSPGGELAMVNHSTSMPGSDGLLPASSVENQDLGQSSAGYTSPGGTAALAVKQ